MSAAMEQVFGTTELFEMILVEVAGDGSGSGMRNLLLCQRVSSAFALAIHSSLKLRRMLWLAPDAKRLPGFNPLIESLKGDHSIIKFSITEEPPAGYLRQISSFTGIERVKSISIDQSGFIDKDGKIAKQSWQKMMLVKGGKEKYLVHVRGVMRHPEEYKGNVEAVQIVRRALRLRRPSRDLETWNGPKLVSWC